MWFLRRWDFNASYRGNEKERDKVAAGRGGGGCGGSGGGERGVFVLCPQRKRARERGRAEEMRIDTWG